jgi:hypothetical protein
MAELKTKATGASVAEFLKGIADPGRRKDCRVVLAMMQEITGSRPKMWGSSIVGFGDHHYKYASGREGDWFVMGFSPRKQDLTLYLTSGVERHRALLEKLGKHKTGMGCLYIKTLDDVDLPTLKRVLRESARSVRQAQT